MGVICLGTQAKNSENRNIFASDGAVRPRALAVLRLVTNSYLVGATGLAAARTAQ